MNSCLDRWARSTLKACTSNPSPPPAIRFDLLKSDQVISHNSEKDQAMPLTRRTIDTAGESDDLDSRTASSCSILNSGATTGRTRWSFLVERQISRRPFAAEPASVQTTPAKCIRPNDHSSARDDFPAGQESPASFAGHDPRTIVNRRARRVNPLTRKSWFVPFKSAT